MQGDQAFQKIQIPDELALAQANPDPWLSPTDRETIARREEAFSRRLRSFGLFTNSEALSKLAWFEYLSGDAEQSVALLSQAADHQKGQGESFESLLSRHDSESSGSLRASADESR